MNRFIKLSSALFMLISLSGCGSSKREDIHILYTTDVHCKIDGELNYTHLAAYKNELKKNNKYVSLLDAGDFSQGDLIGVVSKGDYPIQIMNKVGYDLVTLGNHEFDYGMDVLEGLINKLDASVISCNIKYTGKNKNKLNKVEPYKIVKYGPVKVGYVGVTTPFTIGDSTPGTFMEDGQFVYNFSNETAEIFYNTIQTNVDKVKAKGADYVILLSHSGYGEEYKAFAADKIINNTLKIDAVLDGHSHKDFDWTTYKNKDGKDVLYVDAGSKLNEFGHLTIKNDGTFKTQYVTSYDKQDEEVVSFINSIKAEYETESKKVVATSDIALSLKDADGVRMVRNRETTIGNLCADAYKYITNADIAVVNGGGVRANLPKGNITYADIIAVHPYGNELRLVNATGQEILDYLEFAARDTKANYKIQGEDGKYIADGENGAFANVSGLKYTIDTSITSTVTIDENNMFSGITGGRRVKNVQVNENNTWVNIDPNKTYKFCSHSFLVDGGGDGANMFMDNKHIDCPKKLDYEALIEYITDGCNGNLSAKYSTTEGRINIQ